MSRTHHCCLCGAARKPTQKPVESFGNLDCISMKDHRPILPGAWEQSPGLLANYGMWRNGGTAYGDTHICDDCIIVGLKHLRDRIQADLAAMGVTAGPEETA